MNPGRPASTGPKPVSFGRSDTPATKRGKEIPKYLSNIKNAPTGIRTRVFGSKGRNDWPDYTTGAYIYKYSLINMGPMGFEPMTFRLWAGRSTWLSYGPKSAIDRARTCDQSVNSRTLYLLSYDGIWTPISLNQIKPMFKNQKTLNSNLSYVFTSI